MAPIDNHVAPTRIVWGLRDQDGSQVGIVLNNLFLNKSDAFLVQLRTHLNPL